MARGFVFRDTEDYFVRGRRGLINFSNLGSQEFEDDYGGYTVEGVYSGTAEQREGPVCCFNFATVRRRLHGTLMYYTNVWSPDTAAAFVVAFRRRLDSMVDARDCKP
uniref:Uncharacterized protein n=1 Tax=Tetraselmis chuii TaxID=63592 RepID=A0A7S1SV33_9CHLO